MKAIDFVIELEKIAPAEHALLAIGFTKEGAARDKITYQCLPRNTNKELGDELLNLVENYDCTTVEIASINFVEHISVDDDFIEIGLLEVDPIFHQRTTKELGLYDHENPEHLLCKCAKDGASFLDALIVASAFLTKCMFDDGIRENNKLVINISEECADRAGGEVYRQFYYMLLGAYI